MTRVLDELVALLSLETIEENLFRGVSQDLGLRQLFGGQVIGQSLSAASQTVAETEVLADAAEQVFLDGFQAEQGHQFIEHFGHAVSPSDTRPGRRRGRPA